MKARATVIVIVVVATGLRSATSLPQSSEAQINGVEGSTVVTSTTLAPTPTTVLPANTSASAQKTGHDPPGHSEDIPLPSATRVPERSRALIANGEAPAYEALVNNEWQESWISGIPEDAVSMYYRWPGIDGLINTYRATGDTIHIDRALAMSHAYLEKGQDTDGDGFLDWYSTWVNRYSHYHVEWRAADGVAAVVNVIHSDPALASYRSQAAPLVEYLKRDVWQKWEASLDSPYPHFIGRLGLIALALSNATGDQQYQDYITQHGAALRAQIYDKGSFFWETDVSHLGDAVSFMVEAHLAGLVFTDADMQQLVSAAKLSWNGNPAAPQFKDYLDGQTAMTPVGRNQGGWIKLSLFDDELGSIYRAWADTSDIHDNTWIQAQIYGALAVTATLENR